MVSDNVSTTLEEGGGDYDKAHHKLTNGSLSSSYVSGAARMIIFFFTPGLSIVAAVGKTTHKAAAGVIEVRRQFKEENPDIMTYKSKPDSERRGALVL